LYQLVDVGGGELIRALKLGGINHDRVVREWVKTVYMPER
jgi:hypothetical protein